MQVDPYKFRKFSGIVNTAIRFTLNILALNYASRWPGPDSLAPERTKFVSDWLQCKGIHSLVRRLCDELQQ
jgi:hypothetical protein